MQYTKKAYYYRRIMRQEVTECKRLKDAIVQRISAFAIIQKMSNEEGEKNKMKKFIRITAIILALVTILGVCTVTASAADNDYSISTSYYRIGTGKRLDVYTDSKMAGCGTPYIQLGTSLLAQYAEVKFRVQDLTNGKTTTVTLLGIPGLTPPPDRT